MEKISMAIMMLFSLTACGINPPNDVTPVNPPVLNNFSTHTTITGNIAVADKPVGKFVSSLSNGITGNFKSTTTRGAFLTATQMSVPVGTAVVYEKLTDIPSSTLINQLLRGGSITVTVQSVISLVP